MNGQGEIQSAPFPPRVKLAVGIALVLLGVFLLSRVRSILSPFLWALLAGYLLSPIVNYLNVRGKLPRLWSVFLIYSLTGMALFAASRYLYPLVIDNGTVFIEDIPRLEASLINLVGPRPLGVDIQTVVDGLVRAVTGYTNNTKDAGHLLVNAFETLLALFLFLVSTFYLLMDAPRIKASIRDIIPEPYRDELVALGTQINVTWQQYIRGELLLFGIMATATSIGLLILQVPGALILGIVSGALELLPLVGPWTAGFLAVSVAYFSGGNPFGWQQVAYAGAVALMYFVLRQLEDYMVIPNVLGRAVRLHPLIIIFAVTAGGVTAGLFGLVIAVPVAASIKEVLGYLYCKLFDLPLEFDALETNDGGSLQFPIPHRAGEVEDIQPNPPGRAQNADAS
jgi:predicted PurR-regulated permease PerM